MNECLYFYFSIYSGRNREVGVTEILTTYAVGSACPGSSFSTQLFLVVVRLSDPHGGIT